ncbi:succinate dehydrogenase, cytochrome b556 subunit [Chelativorans sp. YIM 93263]|uniref:succinate dehydrogenase, cytochrome b556 subunit n=1 Tax=Chelativorans sp. YIM 93263 TaxID=2906648 RepID=UPI0023790705|nr:succinate dehydrogenase [Chelativorans sp. YIM 93263]
MRHSPRRHRNYVAFLGHRLSGIALAIFLPFHFLALGLALEGAGSFDAFLAFADIPLVKMAEWGLVVLLALHLFFGLRILVLEFMPWRSDADDRAGLIGWGAGGALALGLVFLLGVF